MIKAPTQLRRLRVRRDRPAATGSGCRPTEFRNGANGCCSARPRPFLENLLPGQFLPDSSQSFGPVSKRTAPPLRQPRPIGHFVTTEYHNNKSHTPKHVRAQAIVPAWELGWGGGGVWGGRGGGGGVWVGGPLRDDGTADDPKNKSRSTRGESGHTGWVSMRGRHQNSSEAAERARSCAGRWPGKQGPPAVIRLFAAGPSATAAAQKSLGPGWPCDFLSWIPLPGNLSNSSSSKMVGHGRREGGLRKTVSLEGCQNGPLAGVSVNRAGRLSARW